MAIVVNCSPSLYDALKAEGFTLPEECCDVRLIMPVDGAYQLHYEVNLTAENLAAIGRALIRVATRPEPRDSSGGGS